MSLSIIKKVIILLLIGGVLLGGMDAKGIASTPEMGNSKRLVKNAFSEILEKPELSVAFESSLESHRSDGIPSIKSQSEFTFNLNVTNINSTSAYAVKLNFSLNNLGVLVDSTGEETNSDTIEIGTLDGKESYLSKEYTVRVTDNVTVSESCDLVIVLDQSGSMGDEIEALTSDLISVVNELADTIPDIRIGLILFGGVKENPYIYDELITPLTSNISQIVDVFEHIEASGSTEPWGDALWVAQHLMDWRVGIPNLIVLITDEPGDRGVKYNPMNLNTLYEELQQENFILCTVAASGSTGLTIARLQLGAEITGGTFVQIGSKDFPSTADLPRVIKQFIETHSIERVLKLAVNISYLTDPFDAATEETIKKVFIVLVDDLPPELRTWVSYAEDFYTDTKYVNIMIEVLDVSRIPFVEIYYRFDSLPTWVIATSTNISEDTFVLSLTYDSSNEKLEYYIYTKDYVGNEVVSEVYTIELSEISIHPTLIPNELHNLFLQANQSSVISLETNETTSFGLVRSFLPVHFLLLDSTFEVIAEEETNFTNFDLSPNTKYKLKIWARNTTGVTIFNVEKLTLEYDKPIEKKMTYNQVYLFYLDNRLNLTEQRSIMADSELVHVKIEVYDLNWTQIASSYTEVILPEKECYVLVYSTYHEGTITISFDLESENEPSDPYYETASFQYFFLIFAMVGLGSLRIMRKHLKFHKNR